jgi:hypothetical protein
MRQPLLELLHLAGHLPIHRPQRLEQHTHTG